MDVGDLANRNRSAIDRLAMIEHSPIAIYTAGFGAQGRWDYVTFAIEELLGLPASDLIDDPSLWLERIHPDDRERVLDAESRSRDSHGSLSLEYRMVRDDGSVLWISDEARVVEDADGRLRLQGCILDITARKKAEIALADSEALKSAIIGSALDCVIAADAAGRIIEFNPAAEKVFGYSRREAIGMTLADTIVPEEHREAHSEGLRHYLRTGKARVLDRRLELSGRRKDGSTFPVELAITDASAAFRRESVFVAYLRDISDRKQAEAEQSDLAHQQEGALHVGRLALEGIAVEALFEETVSVCMRSLGCDYALVAELIQEQVVVRAFAGGGIERGTVLDGTHVDFIKVASEPVIVEDAAAETRFELPPYLENLGIVGSVSIPIDGGEGTAAFLAVYWRTAHHPTSHEMSFIQSLANTLSIALRRERVETRAGLQARLLDEVNVGIAIVDAEFRVTFLNKGVQQILGWSEEETMGRSVFDFVGEGMDLAPAFAVQSTVLEGTRGEREFDVRRKDGGVTPVFLSGSPLFDDDGSFAGAIGVFVDLTEQKALEHAVRESELRLRALVENSNDVISVVDGRGSITFMSPALENLTGFTPGEVLGMNGLDFIHPDDLPRALDALASIMESPGEARMLEVRGRTKAGEWLWLEVRGINRLDDPIIGGIVLNYHDITARKESEAKQRDLETQLLQSQKMEALGVLAGGVAHDFNNLLSAILNYASFVDEGLSKDDPNRDDVREILAATDRAISLVRQLLAFSRKDIVKPESLSLGEATRSLRKMLERLLGEDVHLELSIDADVPQVTIDRGQFDQILMNLVVNARDAMPTGGKLTIRVARARPSVDGPAAMDDLQGSFVEVEVADTGTGIEESVMARMFEPFFTTKARGVGTGLGLSTVYGIVTQAGGSLSVASELGQGTAVRVLLPAGTSDASIPERGDSALPLGLEGKTALVVEDDDAVRDVVERVLVRAGMNVWPAASASEALALAERLEEIHVLLTDVVMPGMSGRELADELVRRGFEGVIVYMSGYTDALIAKRGVLAADEIFIQKPFNPVELTQTMAEALAGSA